VAKKEKSPAFQFYPKDFLSDMNVQIMTNEDVGVYIKLLCHCWLEGSIPSDQKDLTMLAGARKISQKVIKCFTKKGTVLIHPRLEKEKKKQKEFNKTQSASGKKGAEARWGKGVKGDGDPNGVAITTPMAKNGSSSPSSSSSSTPDKKYFLEKAKALAEIYRPFQPFEVESKGVENAAKWLEEGVPYEDMASAIKNLIKARRGASSEYRVWMKNFFGTDAKFKDWMKVEIPKGVDPYSDMYDKANKRLAEKRLQDIEDGVI